MDSIENENKSNGALIGIIVIVILLIIGVIAFGGSDDDMSTTDMDTAPEMDMTDEEMGVMVGGALMTPDLTIVENAQNANNVTTLVAAVEAADLVETLNGPGPFTVFAPTNAAFDDLPDGTVDDLLMPENQEQLQGVLTYHVVPGEYMAADLTDGLELTTVNGEVLTFTVDDMGMLMINGEAMVETANVESSNGITHVIDTVLLPSA
tara:strand:+ start:113 stop:733 length:621 start_codon:yes stop_codon:yes gene_type:complete